MRGEAFALQGPIGRSRDPLDTASNDPQDQSKKKFVCQRPNWIPYDLLTPRSFSIRRSDSLLQRDEDVEQFHAMTDGKTLSNSSSLIGQTS